MINTNDIIVEWIKPAIAEWDDAVLTTCGNSSFRIYTKGDLMGVYVVLKETIATLILPDSITNVVGQKEYTYDLHEPDSLQRLSTKIVESIRTFRKNQTVTPGGDTCRLALHDVDVLVDLLLERLPMVWQDTIEAIEGGEKPVDVLKETYDGHVVRILRRLGHDVEDWFRELKDYVGVT